LLVLNNEIKALHNINMEFQFEAADELEDLVQKLNLLLDGLEFKSKEELIEDIQDRKVYIKKREKPGKETTEIKNLKRELAEREKCLEQVNDICEKIKQHSEKSTLLSQLKEELDEFGIETSQELDERIKVIKNDLNNETNVKKLNKFKEEFTRFEVLKKKL